MANKPWLKKKKEREIEVMGAKIQLQELSYGNSRKAVSEAMEVDVEGDKKPKFDATLMGTLRALYQIKDWELTDEKGEKLPITLETLDNELDDEFVTKMLEQIEKNSDSSLDEGEKKE